MTDGHCVALCPGWSRARTAFTPVRSGSATARVQFPHAWSVKPPHTPENWDAASQGYAEHVAPVLMRPYVEELADRLDANPEHEALEVAAGSGILTEPLARRVKSLLATDFAPQMLEILRKRMRAAGVTNVTVEEMDGQALKVEDATFDRAACNFALMLFPDRAKGFSELRRVLRPGGRAMVSAWAGPDKFEAFGLFLSALKVAFPDMPPPPTPPPVFSLADPANFRAEMEAAGFCDVDVDYVSRELELADFEASWSMFTAGAPPVQVLLDRVGPEGKQRVREALAAIIEDRFGSGGIRVRNVATIGCGTVP